MPNRLKLAGKTIGRLTVIEYLYTKDSHAYWRCRCSCGKEIIVAGSKVNRKKTIGCGCLKGKHLIGTMDEKLKRTISPMIKDICVTAGIYEGEGSCDCNKGSSYATITQKDPWILYKIQSLFGGSVRLYMGGIGHKLYFKWGISGARSRGFLMTIYSLLSPKRQAQIRRALCQTEI